MWSVWSQCSSECDSGVQTRERFCNSPSPQHEGSSCPGPHIQTRDCNSHPCLGTVSCFLIIQDPQGHGQICAKLCVDLFKIQPYFSFLNYADHSINVFMSNIQSWFSLLSLLSDACPEGMVYMTAAECEAHGGACPRVCLDMTSAEVQCATACYDGCYCSLGLYLLNGSCVPLAQCPCYHQGQLYTAGGTLPLDACNNWYCQQRLLCL